MTQTLRKNITISAEDYQTIEDYGKKMGLGFSQAIRKTAISYIQQVNEMSLLEFLNTHCDTVDAIEQKEIESLKIDFSDLEGEEISVGEFLSNRV